PRNQQAGWGDRSLRAAGRLAGTGGLTLGQQAVDEADDRACRLEPEEDEDVLRADAAVEARLERADRGDGQLTLRREEGPVIKPRSFEQHELQEEQRPDVAHVVDRLRQPAGELLTSLGRRLEQRTVGPPRAGLRADGLDQASAFEQLDCPVDERPSDRPDAA